MQQTIIEGLAKKSVIVTGADLQDLPEYLPAGRRVIYISDETVWQLYGKNLTGDHILIGRGENHKTLSTLEYIYERLLELNADRRTFIVALGGGIVCDVAGFAASTYMRGVDYGFVATTLLAQTDASVGGKNGVNVKGYKNIAGVFNQPYFVLCPPAVLKTLPQNEIANGMAEIIKHALIADLNMFKYIEANAAAIKNLEPECINYLVRRSVEIKAGVVNRDEREQGERRKLNFGHTLGHAMEKSMGISHGEAVAAGMLFAVALSIAVGDIAPEFYARLRRVYLAVGLPAEMPVVNSEHLQIMSSDKKREGDAVNFVLLKKIGRAYVRKIQLAEMDALFLTATEVCQ